MDKLTIGAGPLELPFRGTTVNVTAHMLTALDRMRPALITVAQTGGTITYGQLARATGDAYLPLGFGRALDVLSIDCANRGEPSLAALVVNGGGGEVGDAFVGDPVEERHQCYAHWAR